MRLARLNGWQRLWVVVAALLLPIAAGMIAKDYPTEADWRKQGEASITFAAITGEIVRIEKDCENRFGLLTAGADDCIKAEKPRIDELRTAARTALDIAQAEWESELRAERQWVIGRGLLLWWVAPSIALYALGLALAWVRRGFRIPS